MKWCVVVALVLCGVLAANAAVYRYDLDTISHSCRLSILNENGDAVCGRWCKPAEAQRAYDKSTCDRGHCTCTFEEKIPLTHNDLCRGMKIDDPQGNFVCKESSPPADNNAVGECFSGHHYSHNGAVCVAYSRKYKDFEVAMTNWKEDFPAFAFVSIPNVMNATFEDLVGYAALIDESISRAADQYSRFHSVIYEPFVKEHATPPPKKAQINDRDTEFKERLMCLAAVILIFSVSFTLTHIIIGVFNFFWPRKIRIKFEDTCIRTSITFSELRAGKLTTAYLYEAYPNYVFKYDSAIIMRDIKLKHYYGKKLKATRIARPETPSSPASTSNSQDAKQD